MKVKRIRFKSCSRCEVQYGTLYRVLVDQRGDWEFVCQLCLEKLKPGNPYYQYGGTWKSKKRT